MRRRRLVQAGIGVALMLALLALTLGGFSIWRLHTRSQAQRRLAPIVMRASRRHRVNPALVMAVIRQESNFDPDARGSSGEIGLMQLMPGAVQDWETAHRRELGHRGLLFRPAVNIEIGAWYLARAMRQFQHHPQVEVLALSQYNAGRSRALKWESDYSENLLQSIPIPSTRHYISNVMEYRAIYDQEVKEIGNEK